MTDDMSQDARALERLYETIRDRRGGDAETSYTARLFARGRSKIAQKLGEEAVECVIEGMRGDRQKLKEESADLLYHLLVLWADLELEPAEVWEEIERRRGISGIEEKAGRRGGA